MNNNIPTEFIRRTKDLIGEEECKALVNALEANPPVSIRVNEAKGFDVPAKSARLLWSSNGYYLSERPSFTLDPLFHAGCYYVQEASSIFLEHVLKQLVKEPVTMLDLCAAPGGKSTLARSVLPEGSLLVANEVVRSRAQVLAENMIKWGHDAVVVTNNDAQDFRRAGVMFDIVLTDVPCSGEGMFRKDVAAREEWSEDNVNLCCQRQRRIVADIWSCLKPGGFLIYSTCTFNHEENEDNVEWIANELGAEVMTIDVRDEWNVTGNLSGSNFPVYRFLPHKTKGEGLFMAVLRKTSEDSIKPIRLKKNKSAVPFPKQLKSWLNIPDKYAYEINGNFANAFPIHSYQHYQSLKSSLRVIHAGITLGELKGKDWQPNHSLAMSTSLNADTFPTANLSLEQSLSYLRSEAIVLDDSLPKGYVLLTYAHHPLGFAKNIGNRANNLYPNDWRIRKQT